MSTSDKIAIWAIIVPSSLLAIQLIVLLLGYLGIVKSINERRKESSVVFDQAMEKFKTVEDGTRAVIRQVSISQAVIASIAIILFILVQIAKRRGMIST